MKTVYLAVPDPNQPVAAAVQTLEAAQKVVEEIAAESASFPLPDGLRWVNLKSIGYPTVWSYSTGEPGSTGDEFGMVQRIEVTEG